MTKVDSYREILQNLSEWDSYLLAESGLTGPRGNLELLEAVSEVGSEARFTRYLTFDPENAPRDQRKEIKGFGLLQGVRGKPPADLDALVDVIMKVSAMVTELEDRVEELDINPLIVYPEKMGAKAAEAMIVLRSSE